MNGVIEAPVLNIKGDDGSFLEFGEICRPSPREIIGSQGSTYKVFTD